MSKAKYYINLDCCFGYVKKSDSKNSSPSDFADEVIFFYFVVLCYSAIGTVDILQHRREKAGKREVNPLPYLKIKLFSQTR